MIIADGTTISAIAFYRHAWVLEPHWRPSPLSDCASRDQIALINTARKRTQLAKLTAKPWTRDWLRIGAGEGNRTLVCSLGSCRSAIELRPRVQVVHFDRFERACRASSLLP
jgi:hypothetical protein